MASPRSSSPSAALGRPVDPVARASRRGRILAAARGCFAAKGFHAASTAEISTAAGVSVANLYQYFPSKDDLVVALCEDDLARDLESVLALAAGPSLAAGMEAGLEELAAEAKDAERLRLRMEIFAEAFRNERVRAAVMAAEGALTVALRDVLARARERGEVRADLDLTAAAGLLAALIDGLYSRAALGLLEVRSTRASLRELLDRWLV
jgi:TetR/AcrR family transcriptional regulator, repressor for uid operon